MTRRFLPSITAALLLARALIALDCVALSPEVISDTLGAVLKYQDDIAKIAGAEATRLLEDLKRQYPATNAGRLAVQKLEQRN